MKCPKCGYLGFESVDRCRNCGYDFSLTTADLLELPLKTTSPKNVDGSRRLRPSEIATPPDDLSFLDAAMPSEPVHLSSAAKPEALAPPQRHRRRVHHAGVAACSARRFPTMCRSSPDRRRRGRRWPCAARRPKCRGCAACRRARQRWIWVSSRPARDAVGRARRRRRLTRRRDAGEDRAGRHDRRQVRGGRDRPDHSRGDRCRRGLFHDADLRHRLRRSRHPAPGAAVCVSPRAERRLPRRVHGRRPDAREDGRGHQGGVRRTARPRWTSVARSSENWCGSCSRCPPVWVS